MSISASAPRIGFTFIFLFGGVKNYFLQLISAWIQTEITALAEIYNMSILLEVCLLLSRSIKCCRILKLRNEAISVASANSAITFIISTPKMTFGFVQLVENNVPGWWLQKAAESNYFRITENTVCEPEVD